MSPPGKKDVVETLFQLLDLCRVEWRGEPDHQLPVHVAHAVVAAVEPGDARHGGINGVHSLKQRQVRLVDISLGQELFLKKADPLDPVSAPGSSTSTSGRGLALAGLDKGERLHGLIESSEPAGKKGHGVRLLEERHLAVEKYL